MFSFVKILLYAFSGIVKPVYKCKRVKALAFLVTCLGTDLTLVPHDIGFSFPIKFV